MNRITDTFKQLRSQSRVALIPFVTAGDPDRNLTVPLLHGMVTAGADILELGVPFSDPMADGPVIQRASERALANGIALQDCLDMVRTFRVHNTTTPVVLMGYLNPIEAMGYTNFAQQAAVAGVDGVLTVDSPPEESSELLTTLRTYNIDPIYLIAPTTTTERIRSICDAASGFVYYVSIKGVTGATHLDATKVMQRVKQIRNITQLPLGIGFGINDAMTAASMAQIADAVIVGSAIVRKIEALREQPQILIATVAEFLTTLRQALDSVPLSI